MAALGAGTLLYFLAAWTERSLGTDLLAAVLVEESCKTGLLLGFAILAPRVCPRGKRLAPSLPPETDGLVWGISAIVVFAAAENLAYFAAFPGSGIFLRLAWSEPVHLVSALAEAEAVWLLLRLRKRIGIKAERKRETAQATKNPMARPQVFGLVAGIALSLALAVAWHLAFNLAADGPIQALERLGDEAGLAWRSAILGALIANLAALAALGYRFAHRVMVGGFLYGSD